MFLVLKAICIGHSIFDGNIHLSCNNMTGTALLGEDGLRIPRRCAHSDLIMADVTQFVTKEASKHYGNS